LLVFGFSRIFVRWREIVYREAMMKLSDQSTPRPVLLCILDGWGERADPRDNAILQANTPVWTRLSANAPHASLATSGLAVGLPDGQMGNSEVGHMNLGAGRVVMQDLPRIDRAISDGSLASDPKLLDAIASVSAAGGRFHLLGLLSPGGVHAHQDHLAAVARIIAGAGVGVSVHCFLDGRDTPPRSAEPFLRKFIADCAGLDIGIATVGGRYYAMDRDQRWDRVLLARDAILAGEGPRGPDALTALAVSYQAGKSDEFMLPTVIGDYRGIKDGDGLLMGNFRADRAREILHALGDPDFDPLPHRTLPHYAARLGIADYSTALAPLFPALFPAETLHDILGEVVSKAGRTQLRIAETEKYAHVTFFFNGGEEQVYALEDRILVPSPKVATYDLQPAMSAVEVTDRLVGAILSHRYDLIVVNYANGDMVGHTGMLGAAILAVETIDACLGRLESAIIAAGGTMLITADHGNAELMKDQITGEPYTAHTTGPVPLVLVNAPFGITSLEDGKLADVAPTLLSLMGLPQPAAMTGRSLIRVALDAG
jgi:2,3-bisphosphoglycerate-independent phosphoglycerate mutase